MNKKQAGRPRINRYDALIRAYYTLGLRSYAIRTRLLEVGINVSRTLIKARLKEWEKIKK